MSIYFILLLGGLQFSYCYIQISTITTKNSIHTTKYNRNFLSLYAVTSNYTPKDEKLITNLTNTILPSAPSTLKNLKQTPGLTGSLPDNSFLESWKELQGLSEKDLLGKRSSYILLVYLFKYTIYMPILIIQLMTEHIITIHLVYIFINLHTYIFIIYFIRYK